MVTPLPKGNLEYLWWVMIFYVQTTLSYKWVVVCSHPMALTSELHSGLLQEIWATEEPTTMSHCFWNCMIPTHSQAM